MKTLKEFWEERRGAMPEKAIQSAIQAWLRTRGFMSVHIPNRGLYNPRTKRYNLINDPHFVAGIPDLVIMLRGGGVVWCEVKAKKGVLSPAQRAFHARLACLGHSVIVARSVEDVEKAFSEMGITA